MNEGSFNNMNTYNILLIFTTHNSYLQHKDKIPFDFVCIPKYKAQSAIELIEWYKLKTRHPAIPVLSGTFQHFMEITWMPSCFHIFEPIKHVH